MIFKPTVEKAKINWPTGSHMISRHGVGSFGPDWLDWPKKLSGSGHSASAYGRCEP